MQSVKTVNGSKVFPLYPRGQEKELVMCERQGHTTYRVPVILVDLDLPEDMAEFDKMMEANRKELGIEWSPPVKPDITPTKRQFIMPKKQSPKVIYDEEGHAFKKKRGRQPLPENVGIPTQFECSGCSKPIKVAPSLTRKAAKKAGMSVDEYIANYKCRQCRKKERIENVDASLNINKIKCTVCKELKGTSPSALEKQIEKAGVTPEEYIKNYVCRSCRSKVKEDTRIDKKVQRIRKKIAKKRKRKKKTK